MSVRDAQTAALVKFAWMDCCHRGEVGVISMGMVLAVILTGWWFET